MKVKAPYQGPDPYNSWKECEEKLNKLEIRLKENISELLSAEKVVRAAQAFAQEYSSSVEQAEELESFDRLMYSIDFYNKVK